jgi:predicted ABC-type transport system involved in lysophospholipase L1 biosynthesis ATPase subunit
VTERRTVVLITHDPKIASHGQRMLTLVDGLISNDDHPLH